MHVDVIQQRDVACRRECVQIQFFCISAVLITFVDGAIEVFSHASYSIRKRLLNFQNCVFCLLRLSFKESSPEVGT